MAVLIRLDAAVRAAAPIVGVSVGTPGVSASVRVDFDPAATADQRAAAQAVVDGFDWSDAAQAAWELSQSRTRALTSFFARSDETAIAVRAWLSAYIFLANNRLETLGQPRVLANEVLAYIAANPTLGDPLV